MLPEFNPPWSQPVCWRCYKKRYHAICKVFASWKREEKCHDCDKPTKQGIYIDPRPPKQRRFGWQPGPSPTKSEIAAWKKELICSA